MILEIIMGLYLLILAIDDMLNKSIGYCLLAAGAVPIAVSFIPGMTETAMWQRAAGLMLGLLLIVIAKLTKEKIGYGDGIVLSEAGVILGIGGVCKILTVSLFLLLFHSMAMLARGRLNRKSRVPFMPFLFAGYLLIAAA